MSVPRRGRLNTMRGGGLTTLIGDVVAGPGSGVQGATIPAGTISYAQMQPVTMAERLLGRGQGGGAGPVQELTLGVGLAMLGTVVYGTGKVFTWDPDLKAYTTPRP